VTPEASPTVVGTDLGASHFACPLYRESTSNVDQNLSAARRRSATLSRGVSIVKYSRGGENSKTLVLNETDRGVVLR